MKQTGKKHPVAIEDHKRFMQMAIDLSEIAIDSGKGGPFGAIIVQNRKIIGSSGNCVFQNTDPTSHAEIMAIRDACANIQKADLKGATIYSSGEPCPMCMAAIYWAKITNVYYANSEDESLEYGFIDKLILAEIKKSPDKRAIVINRIHNPTAIGVFKKAARKGIAHKRRK